MPHPGLNARRRRCRWRTVCLSATAWLLVSLVGVFAQKEIGLSQEYSEKLDPFELHQLRQADASFKQKSYAAARAAYDAFLLEFPQSDATAYAIFRKGRSLHLENKRYEAIKVYQEVIDYFPNEIDYAAPALYYIGDAEWENGDKAKAAIAWRKIIQDEAYQKVPLAASAMNRLADASKGGESVTDYERVAESFRTSNPAASREAMAKVIAHYVEAQDEPALRRFYTRLSGFENEPAKLTGAPEADPRYWNALIDPIKERGSQFPESQLSRRKAFFKYWAGQLGEAAPPSDLLALHRLRFAYEADGDRDRWLRQLDEQYARMPQPPDNRKTLAWLEQFAGMKERQKRYFDQIQWKELSFEQARQLLITLLRDLKNPELAETAASRLPKYSDQQRLSIARNHEIWSRSGTIPQIVLAGCEDRDFGKYQLLRIYLLKSQIREGVALADEVIAIPEYASEAYYIKGRLQYEGKQYDAAIRTLRQSQQQPNANFVIADAHVRLGQIDEAVALLREVENFFKPQAPEAAWRIAVIYGETGRREERIAALRAVLTKYPGSGQSRNAHQELEKMGVRIGGGLNAEN